MQIIKGKRFQPPRILIHGPEKIGKSTFGASAPSPIFVQTENGLDAIGADRFPVANTLDDVLAGLQFVADGDHDYATVCIDSMDWLEQLIYERVCKDSGVKSVELAAGGYGKGYVEANNWMRYILLDMLEPLRSKRNMAIILISHSKIERIEEPGASSYDRYAPRLHKHALATVCEWVDVIGFATRKARVEKEETRGKVRNIAKPVGKGGGERILRVVSDPAWVAGNRFDIQEDLPLSWDALAAVLMPEEPAIQQAS